MPTGLPETDFECATQDLAANIAGALESFCARWGVSPPLPQSDAFIDLAGDILMTQPAIVANLRRPLDVIAA